MKVGLKIITKLSMAIKQEEIHKLFKEGFPDADIEINDLAGDDNHYSAKIKSSKFKGKTRVQQHQMVYASLKGKMGNELHALALTTEEK